MRHFDYTTLADWSWTGNTLQAIAQIHEHKGRQLLYLQQKPQALQQLIEIAKIQSIDASNRLEGIVTTNARLRELVREETRPLNRSEQEIAGYREVLNLIHESHEAIPLSPNILLQLHRDLFSQVPGQPGGHFKTVENRIEERHPDGTRIVRFQPLPPADTPGAVEEICSSFNTVRADGSVEPLLLIPTFVLDFVSIHPFADGNGRLSRLLLALLLYQSDFLIGKYISLEKLVQESSAQYYDVLLACNKGWHEGRNDPTPFIDYTLGILLQAYREFERRLGLVTEGRAYDLVRSVCSGMIGLFAMRDLVEQIPTLSRASVEKSVKKLAAEGILERRGKGRGTSYLYRGTEDLQTLSAAQKDPAGT